MSQDEQQQCTVCGEGYAQGFEGICRSCWEKDQFYDNSAIVDFLEAMWRQEILGDVERHIGAAVYRGESLRETVTRFIDASANNNKEVPF